MVRWIVGPSLVFVELLAHEDHRNPRGAHDDAERNPCPAGRIPRSRIAAADGKRGHSQAPVAIDLVMAFDVLDGTPCIRKPASAKLVNNPLPAQRHEGAPGSLLKNA